MKRKGTILSIICFTLVLLNIVPLFSYAGNGQSSFCGGNSYVNKNPYYGFVNVSYPYVSDDTGIVFTLSLGNDTSSNSAHLYLCPVYAVTSYQQTTYGRYIQVIKENDILKNPNLFTNGQHVIYTELLGLSVGSYKLVAIVNEQSITPDIYEYYFLYTGKTLGLLGDGAVRTKYIATLREQENGQIVDTPLTNHSYNTFFNYTGTLTPLSDGTTQVTIRLSLGEFQFTDIKAGYYDITFKSLTFDLRNNDGFYTCDYLNVSVFNHNTSTTTHIGTINNLSRRNQTSESQPYTLSFPASLFSSGDRLTLVLNFLSYEAHTSHIGTLFDYSVSCGDIWISAYSGKIFNANQSIENLTNAGDALSNVDRPEIDFGDLDINDIIGSDSINSASSYFESLYSFEIIGIMLMVVAILVLLSYLFFGKK